MYSSSNDPIHRLWHDRMGHRGMQNLKKLQSMSTGLDLSHLPHEDCLAKLASRGDVPHRDSLAQNTKPYEVIFSDVEGHISMKDPDSLSRS